MLSGEQERKGPFGNPILGEKYKEFTELYGAETNYKLDL